MRTNCQSRYPALLHPWRYGRRSGSGAVVEVRALPRVTPYLLRRADTMCARRLARGGEERVPETGPRDRIARPFVATLEFPNEAPGAHRVGPAEEIRGDLREGSLGKRSNLGHTSKVSLGPREGAYLD